ncbi:unnamed protein product, partial [Polarella glacialis]
AELDPCWAVDPTQIPLADQMRIESRAGRPPWGIVAQVQSDGRLFEQMDKAYSDAYEDLQLAARLVDWLVATRGCQNLPGASPKGKSLLLNSSAAAGERWPPWTRIWGRHRLRRVGAGVLGALQSPWSSGQPPR